MGTKRPALVVIISIVLIALIVAIVNVAVGIVLEKPQFNDYCVEAGVDPDGFRTLECNRDKFESDQQQYNQQRFYILASVGFVLLLIGLFVDISFIQYTGLASGAFLVIQSMVTNFKNKIAVLISLVLILFIFGYFASRKIRGKK